ncbi:MAG: hypothetical protein AAF493_04290 [Pseudomonadota bacterium]
MIESRLSDDGTMFVHRASGTVGRFDLFVAVNHWFDDPHFDPMLPVLWDLRGAVIDVSLSEVQLRPSAFADTINAIRANAKTAIVLSSRLSVTMVETFVQLRPWQIQIEIFENDVDGAIAWLRADRQQIG